MLYLVASLYQEKKILRINYFDEGTFLYYEENIIGKKFKDINNETYVDSSVSIVHNESISVDKSIGSLKKYKILKESQRYYQKKYNNVGIIKLFFLKVTYYISYFISYIIIKLSKKTR